MQYWHNSSQTNITAKYLYFQGGGLSGLNKGGKLGLTERVTTMEHHQQLSESLAEKARNRALEGRRVASNPDRFYMPTVSWAKTLGVTTWRDVNQVVQQAAGHRIAAAAGTDDRIEQFKRRIVHNADQTSGILAHATAQTGDTLTAVHEAREVGVTAIDALDARMKTQDESRQKMLDSRNWFRKFCRYLLDGTVLAPATLFIPVGTRHKLKSKLLKRQRNKARERADTRVSGKEGTIGENTKMIANAIEQHFETLHRAGNLGQIEADIQRLIQIIDGAPPTPADLANFGVNNIVTRVEGFGRNNANVTGEQFLDALLHGGFVGEAHARHDLLAQNRDLHATQGRVMTQINEQNDNIGRINFEQILDELNAVEMTAEEVEIGALIQQLTIEFAALGHGTEAVFEGVNRNALTPDEELTHLLHFACNQPAGGGAWAPRVPSLIGQIQDIDTQRQVKRHLHDRDKQNREKYYAGTLGEVGGEAETREYYQGTQELFDTFFNGFNNRAQHIRTHIGMFNGNEYQNTIDMGRTWMKNYKFHRDRFDTHATDVPAQEKNALDKIWGTLEAFKNSMEESINAWDGDGSEGNHGVRGEIEAIFEIAGGNPTSTLNVMEGDITELVTDLEHLGGGDLSDTANFDSGAREKAVGAREAAETKKQELREAIRKVRPRVPRFQLPRTMAVITEMRDHVQQRLDALQVGAVNIPDINTRLRREFSTRSSRALREQFQTAHSENFNRTGDAENTPGQFELLKRLASSRWGGNRVQRLQFVSKPHKATLKDQAETGERGATIDPRSDLTDYPGGNRQHLANLRVMRNMTHEGQEAVVMLDEVNNYSIVVTKYDGKTPNMFVFDATPDGTGRFDPVTSEPLTTGIVINAEIDDLNEVPYS